MTERDADQTQELQPAGNTGNLYLAPDETVVLSEGHVNDVPFKVGKHSILPKDLSAGDAAFIPKTQAVQEGDDTQEDATQPDAQKPPRRHRGLIVFIVLLVTCALVAAAAWFIYQYRQHQEAMTPHPVWVQIDAPGYDLVDSKIPFHIDGLDMDGKRVESIAFVGPDGWGIELSRGSYVITVASSPLLDDAQFYEVPDVQARVDIPEDAEQGAPIEVGSPKFEFMFANPADITDEEIEAAYTYALESGFEVDTADSYRAALVAKRDEALAVVRAANEKTKRIAAATEALEAKAKENGSTGIGYQIVDLDGDEMPELLLAGNSGSDVGAMCFVYGYDAFSHQVIELCSVAGGGNHSPGIWYSTTTHEVVFATTGETSESLSFYSISSESAVHEYTYSHTWTKGEAPTESFTIGTEPITKQAFIEVIDSLERFSYVASPAL